jgi:hypothetical protein
LSQIKAAAGTFSQHRKNSARSGRPFQEERMPGNRKAKPRQQTPKKPAKTPKRRPDEDLGPERRIGFARQAEARRSRGKPRSI